MDYAAANAFLDAFALSRKGPVTAVNWGSWREVGMAARAISPHPWLEERLLNTPNEIVYAGQFSQQRRWVLSEHKFKNGICAHPRHRHMEMAAGAFTHGSQQGAVEFQNVFFLRRSCVPVRSERGARPASARSRMPERCQRRIPLLCLLARAANGSSTAPE